MSAIGYLGAGGAEQSEPVELSGCVPRAWTRYHQSGRSHVVELADEQRRVIARGFKVPYTGYPASTTLANVLLRKYPQYSNVGLRWTPEGNSWYDSLQVKATKRYSHGLSLTAAFTWSKSLATSSANSQVNNYFNRGTNKSLSAFDRPSSSTRDSTTTHRRSVRTNLSAT
jgi:hypothetical protein